MSLHYAKIVCEQEGGSWEVRVSLAAVAQWIRSLGQLDPDLAFGQGPPMPHRNIPLAEEIAAISEKVQIAKPSRPDQSIPEAELGEMSVIRHAAYLSLTPVCYGSVPYDLDADEPHWIQNQ